MSEKQNLLSTSLLDELSTSGAGYDVLRYISLPELLGSEANTLLYFMGKNLARRLISHTLEDIYHIYDRLGWGRLELVKEQKKSLTFHLMADSVVHRLKAPINAEFRLEAGFLAESIQVVKGKPCECVEEINRKIHQIQFKVIYTD